MYQGPEYVARRELEFANTVLPEAKPIKLSLGEETTLLQKLNQPIQTIQASTFGGRADSQVLVDAKKALSKPQSLRTLKDQVAIGGAYEASGARNIYVKQQEDLYNKQLSKNSLVKK